VSNYLGGMEGETNLPEQRKKLPDFSLNWNYYICIRLFIILSNNFVNNILSRKHVIAIKDHDSDPVSPK